MKLYRFFLMAALVASVISLIYRLFQSYRGKFHVRQLSTVQSKYKLPLPPRPHLILNDDVIKDRHILLIGDVHGCLDELNELLDKVKERNLEWNMLPIFVGDLINKGPKSVETLKRIRNLEHFSVRGNHDEAVLNQVLRVRNSEGYELPPRYQWVTELSDEDVTYLRELPYTISIPSFNAIVVHAGIVPGVPLEDQDLTNMIVMRNLVEEDGGKLIATELTKTGRAWASVWPGPQHVYFGHDATRKLQTHPHATGLDTGCVYGFKLTGLILSRDQNRDIVEIQAKKVYRDPNK